MIELSVIICTHNPQEDYLQRVIRALRNQSLPKDRWELLLVDNASGDLLSTKWDLSWHPNAQHTVEPELGLVRARLRGILESKADILIFVDDDNELAAEYLEWVVTIFRERKNLGAAGGIISPDYIDGEPERWATEFIWALGIRDLGDAILLANDASHPNTFPYFSPIGAGMVLRRAALTSWNAQSASGEMLGRRGRELSSGEDCDIALTALKSGWTVGYFPQLKLTHIISAHRLSLSYLARLNRGIAKSWVELLRRHDLLRSKPAAPWTVPLRKTRAYFRCKAWAGPAEYVRWQAACGNFDGRASAFAKHTTWVESESIRPSIRNRSYLFEFVLRIFGHHR